MNKLEFLDDEDYLRFYDLIQMRTGLRVGENRREILSQALKENLESVKCPSLDQFFTYLKGARTDSEIWSDLIKKVTVGETYFFRDSDTIEALRFQILPDLIARHQKDRTLRLWSAGCATGEEPYTLAILLRQTLSDIDRWKILILATDINRQALSQAIIGRYRAWSFRETNSVIQSTYFTADGDTFTLKPAVREMVTFAYHNLAENNYPSPTNQTNNLDLILCRNVTIYLPLPLIYDIANRFYQCLPNEGWLIVGPSETHLEIYRQFQTVNFNKTTVYRKISGSLASPTLWSTVPDQTDRSMTCLPGNSLAVTPSSRQGTQRTPMSGDMSSIQILQLPCLEQPQTLIVGDPTDDIPIVEPSNHEALKTNHDIDPKRTLPTPTSKAEPVATEGVDLCQQGEEFVKQHRYEEARKCFLSCLAKEPRSTTALYRMARLEANAGRLKEAQKWGEEVLDHDPLRSEMHYTLALVHEMQGEFQEAINKLKKVIYLDPNFILAHFGLFHLYERTGNPTDSERHRTLAVHLASKLSPDAVLPGSDDLTAGQLLTMARAHHKQPIAILGGKTCRSEGKRRLKRPRL
jgi:chemotaxis protein methyltransferase CheR